jgi:hypothetical protein
MSPNIIYSPLSSLHHGRHRHMHLLIPFNSLICN